MAEIRSDFRSKYPHLDHLIKPVHYKSDLDLHDNEQINQWYKLYEKYHNLGSQYINIALWAEELQTALVYTFDKSVTGYTPRQQLINTQLIINDQVARIKANPDPPYIALFQNCEFYYFDISKPEMGKISKENNFYDLMLKTWFCHFPKFNRPCGICDPCATVIRNDLKFRMPQLSLLRYYLKIIFKKYKQ
jgi:hypothetical protein